MSLALAGRVALVTGGSGGIGRALCLKLAQAGAAVAVHYHRGEAVAREVVRAIADGGGRATALAANLGDEPQVLQLAEEVAGALGPIDVLVANAGLGKRAALEEVTKELWQETYRVNVYAPFLLAQRVVPGMQQRKFGRILFTSSVAAFTGGIVGPHYASSKAALHGLTHFLASRLAASGITVNAIAPALIEETGMLPGGSELKSRIPVGRLGKPDEVADLALAVLQNGYVTNQVIAIDGGMHPR